MTWRPKWGVATIALALIAAPGSAAPRRRVMSPRRLGRMTVELSALALVVAALYPAAPQASITVGSDLSLPATSSSENCVLSTPPCTRLLVGVHDGNPFPAKSPADGVILSFGLKTGVLSGANETVTFRLGRVDTITFGGATGAGTGPTVTVHEPGTYSFPAANLPVKAGDYSRGSTAVPRGSNRPFPAEPASMAGDISPITRFSSTAGRTRPRMPTAHASCSSTQS